MNPIGYFNIETAARIVSYRMYRVPTIQEILDGIEYEYVQFAIKQIYTNCPPLDETGHKPTCTCHQSWVKGKWGSPFGLIHISHIKQLMKKNNIRTRAYMSTQELINLNKKYPLSFTIKGLQVVVFPESNGEHPIFINGVNEAKLRAKTESKLARRWFNLETANLSPQTADFRHFLGLDKGKTSVCHNVLYMSLNGVFQQPIKIFDKITENFMTGGGSNNPPNTTKRKTSNKAPKKPKFETSPSSSVRVLTPGKKLEKDLSEAVRQARAIARAKRQLREVDARFKEIDKARKNVLARRANRINKEKMKQNVSVYVHKVTEGSLTEGNIIKLPRYKADKLIADGTHKEVPFSVYSQQQKQINIKRKVAYKDSLEKRTIPRPTPPPLCYTRNEDGEWVQTKVELANPELDIFVLPHGTGTNRKATRRHIYEKRRLDNMWGKYQVIPSKPKMKKVGKDEKGTPIYEPVFERVKYKTKVPVYGIRSIVYGRNHPTKAREPFMIPKVQKDGSLKPGVVVKRFLSHLEEKEVTIKRPVFLSRKNVIIQHNFPSAVRTKRSELKAALSELAEQHKSKQAEKKG